MATVDRAEVLEFASEHSPAEAAERYGISAATVRSWRHRAAGATAVIEADEQQDLPGPVAWPVVEVEVELAGMNSMMPGVTDPDTGISRPRTRAVRCPQMPAGQGRGVQGLTDGQHLRVPNVDAERIEDGDIIAAGSIGLRVMSRRSAAHDRYDNPLQLDSATRERLAKFVLLRIEPARVDAA
ncbi:MAG: helix-turn-helix domain-containing protein [Solirubrobacteraceae bacterium]